MEGALSLYIFFPVDLYFRTIGLGVKGTCGGLGSQSEYSWVWTKLVSHANMAVDTWALRQPACPGSGKGGAGSNPASSTQYFSFLRFFRPVLYSAEHATPTPTVNLPVRVLGSKNLLTLFTPDSHRGFSFLSLPLQLEGSDPS